MERMNEKRVEVISQKVKNYICEKFENERISSKKKMRTRWNNSMESTLDDILKILEIKK